MDVDASLATPSGDRAIGPVACRAHVGVRKQPSRPTTNFPARRPPKRKKIQKELEQRGIDPRTSRMLSERSTT